ncbi:MAG TPA: DUF502 domain-containing protein [Parachlamydiaceae bacterium]|nr:DUF502 domain-containing protein [Parachlamydiaceae bacterium]
MKKLFFTGLITLLPFALTVLIAVFVINLFTDPFQGSVERILDYYGLLESPFLFLSGTDVLHISSKILVIATLLGTIVLIGFFGHMVIAKTLFRFSGYIIQRIPFVNKLYNSTQEVVKTLFNSKGSSFSQAALVPFPHAGAYSMALISERQTPENHTENVSVFIPGTPNPTAGYMLTYRYEEIIFLEMKVEDALKFIISCGIKNPDFK